jgi:hypothetical protein
VHAVESKNKMFQKLNSKIKKVKISESAINFESKRDRKDFEAAVIFGNLVEELDSLSIEEAYSEEKKGV